jgi:hypothetical protein
MMCKFVKVFLDEVDLDTYRDKWSRTEKIYDELIKHNHPKDAPVIFEKCNYDQTLVLTWYNPSHPPDQIEAVEV